jgi:hypothetical protein
VNTDGNIDLHNGANTTDFVDISNMNLGGSGSGSNRANSKKNNKAATFKG